MTTTIIQRIMEALAARGWSQNKLEREASLGRGYMANAKKRGQAMFRPEKVSEIAKLLQVNAQWLLSGEGPMETTEDQPRRVVVRDDVYPSRARVLALAGTHISPEVRAALLLERCSEGDPGDGYWVQRIREIKRLHKDVMAAAADGGEFEG